MLRLNCGSAGRDALNPDEIAHTHHVAFWFEEQGIILGLFPPLTVRPLPRCRCVAPSQEPSHRLRNRTC